MARVAVRAPQPASADSAPATLDGSTTARPNWAGGSLRRRRGQTSRRAASAAAHETMSLHEFDGGENEAADRDADREPCDRSPSFWLDGHAPRLATPCSASAAPPCSPRPSLPPGSALSTPCALHRPGSSRRRRASYPCEGPRPGAPHAPDPRPRRDLLDTVPVVGPADHADQGRQQNLVERIGRHAGDAVVRHDPHMSRKIRRHGAFRPHPFESSMVDVSLTI
jgi:hypothetical protein